MKVRTLTALLLVCACSKDRLQDAPDPTCNTPCYIGTPSEAGKGVCVKGQWKCSEDKPPECVGSGKPGKYQCNGLDNNCDGFIDAPSEACATSCGSGVRLCIGHTMTACMGADGNQEVCNGKDDDCDGIIDNLKPMSISEAACYTGNPTELGYGDCRPGVLKCVNGRSQCIGQVLPKSEVCNHKDDNCNGTVDDGTSLKNKDIIVCMDNSGSMVGVIDQVKYITKLWANKYAGRADLRWALEECPGGLAIHDGKVRLVQNLTDVATFNVAIDKQAAGDTGVEPTLDAVYLTASPDNKLGINWRAGADRTMIIFTDELAQTNNMAVTLSDGGVSGVTAEIATEVAINAGLRVYIFAGADAADTFVPLDTTGGFIADVHASTAIMETQLDSIIDICK